MPKIETNKRRAASQANDMHRWRQAAALVVALGALAVTEYATTHLLEEPMHDSISTGADWVQELLNGDDRLFYEALGMRKPAFFQLCDELQEHCRLRNSRHLSIVEQVAIFLRMCRTGGSRREIARRFRRAPATVLRYVCANFAGLCKY